MHLAARRHLGAGVRRMPPEPRGLTLLAAANVTYSTTKVRFQRQFLARNGLFPQLTYLDISSCFKFDSGCCIAVTQLPEESWYPGICFHERLRLQTPLPSCGVLPGVAPVFFGTGPTRLENQPLSSSHLPCLAPPAPQFWDTAHLRAPKAPAHPALQVVQRRTSAVRPPSAANWSVSPTLALTHIHTQRDSLQAPCHQFVLPQPKLPAFLFSVISSPRTINLSCFTVPTGRM
jgi:hypothetical protein